MKPGDAVIFHGVTERETKASQLYEALVILGLMSLGFSLLIHKALCQRDFLGGLSFRCCAALLQLSARDFAPLKSFVIATVGTWRFRFIYRMGLFLLSNLLVLCSKIWADSPPDRD